MVHDEAIARELGLDTERSNELYLLRPVSPYSKRGSANLSLRGYEFTRDLLATSDEAQGDFDELQLKIMKLCLNSPVEISTTKQFYSLTSMIEDIPALIVYINPKKRQTYNQTLDSLCELRARMPLKVQLDEDGTYQKGSEEDFLIILSSQPNLLFFQFDERSSSP